MRKNVLLLSVMLFVLSLSSAVSAKPTDNLHLNLRLNVWSATWDSNIYYDRGSSYDTSKPGVMIGPTLSVSTRPLGVLTPFANISYLTSTSDYQFNFTNDTYDATRNDFEVGLGSFVGSYFGLMVGYKSISSEWDDTDNALHSDWKLTMSGPAVGALFRIPIGEAFMVTASGSYLFMKGKFSDWPADRDVPGYTIGTDLTYVSEIGLNASVGYRYQRFKWESGRETEAFQGLIMTVSYTFF